MIDWKKLSIIALRRASYRTPMRSNALKKARVGRNQYHCAQCITEGLNVVHKRKEVQLDHIIPVVDPVLGWQGLDSFAQRLFCPEEGYAVLCLPHHEAKTAVEREIRKAHGHYKKKDKK